MSTATRAIHGTDYLRRTRPAARSLSRARALADLRRSYPAEHRKLADDPELRLLGCRRDFRVHLRLHRGVRLWPRDERARIRGCERARLHLRHLHGADRLRDDEP